MAKKAAKKAAKSESISPEITPGMEYIHPQLRGLAVPIDQLTLDPKNARLHDERNLSAIAASLRTYGIRKPVVVQQIDGQQIVRAGNGTVEAAKLNGWSHVPAVLVQEDDTTATGFAIADNRTAELSEWDESALRDLLDELPLDSLDEDFARMLGDLHAEIDAILESETHSSEIGLGRANTPVVEDEPPKPPKKAVTVTGDVWLLGSHRLLCGDSTRSEDVARLMGQERAGLMNTDPPYGVDYSNLNRKGEGKKYDDIANDKLQDKNLQAFLESAFLAASRHALNINAAWYLWHAHLTQGYFSAAAAAAAAANVVLHRQIIWVKKNIVLGRGQYHWKHEPCFMGWVAGNQPPDYGLGNQERTQTTIWELKSVSAAERSEFDHPTPKPVEIFSIPIVKHLKAGEICYEPFAGTGPQFIAAEQLGRVCYGIEVDPKYCDVIVKRWEKLTGKAAVRIAPEGEIQKAA